MISHAWVQLIWWGSICQSILVCQCWWTGIQGISALLLVGPSAKVFLSANVGGLVFKASLLYYLGGPSAKVSLSAKFCLLVVKAYMLYNLYESFYSHCFCCCCCSVCYCCPCVIIYTKQQQHEMIRRTRTTTKT